MLTFSFTLHSPEKALAASQAEIDQLNNEIDAKTKRLVELDAEIARQRAAVQNASGRANTLQNTIGSLEASRKLLITDISETESQIELTELTINKLNLEIDDKEILINHNSKALAESLRKIHDYKSTSFIEQILGYDKFSNFWIDFEQTEIIQKRLGTEVDTLVDLYEDLQKRENAKQSEKAQLAQYQVELSGEKEVVEQTKTQKAVLLKQTKNEEATYQRILAEKEAEFEAFERELADIESKLQSIIDPDSYQTARSGVFTWPVHNFVLTQRFGFTDFSQNNRNIYKYGSHNGIDLAVPTGTPVGSATDGTVKGFGNTDNYPGCRSWGGWVLIEHNNGLSTLYAHLSKPLVSVGQKVSRGQTIALSGSTGISTGPHLHFTTYITQGVKIRRYIDVSPSSYGCGAYSGVSIPMASTDAYVDPMEYLPSL